MIAKCFRVNGLRISKIGLSAGMLATCPRSAEFPHETQGNAMHWKCWLIGHRAEKDWFWPFVCVRCGRSDYDDWDSCRDSWHVRKFWAAYRWCHGTGLRIRLYLHKCSICGRRFNQCPDDADHMPF